MLSFHLSFGWIANRLYANKVDHDGLVLNSIFKVKMNYQAKYVSQYSPIVNVCLHALSCLQTFVESPLLRCNI